MPIFRGPGAQSHGIARHNENTHYQIPVFDPASLGFNVFFDCRDAVWSGSNLVSIINRGIWEGSASIIGTPVQGATMNGFPTIRCTSSAQGLDFLSSPTINSGNLSSFWYGASKDGTSLTAIMGREWAGGPTADVFYALSGGDGPIFFGNGCCVPGVNNPSFDNGSEIIVDTLPHTVTGVVGSVGELLVIDGTRFIPITDGLGTVPVSTGSTTWNFLRGDPSSESINGDTFAVGLLDGALTPLAATLLNAYFKGL